MVIVYVLTLAISQICESTGAEVVYVLPNNFTDVSCPSQPCATLLQYFLANNGTLPVVYNVEYHFLPGVYLVTSTTDLILENLNNFTLVGASSSILSVVICFLTSHQVIIKHSHNVTIWRIMFKQCEGSTGDNFDNYFILDLDNCTSCSLIDVSFSECGLAMHNAFDFTMTNISVEIKKAYSRTRYHGIMLVYDDEFWDNTQQHIYTINHTVALLSDVTIAGHKYTRGVAISVSHPGYYVNILMNKVKFYTMEQQAMSISTDSALGVWVKDCDFMLNEFLSVNTRSFKWMIYISIKSGSLEVNITFTGCVFFKNNYWESLIKTDIVQKLLKSPEICTISFVLQGCKFTKNTSPILDINGGSCVLNLAVVGPSHIVNTHIPQSSSQGMIHVSKAVVTLAGPVDISYNSAPHVILCEACSLLFSNNILLDSNTCYDSLISLHSEQNYIKVMEYSNIEISHNKIKAELFILDSGYHRLPYAFCVFQYVTSKRNSSSASVNHYTVTMEYNYVQGSINSVYPRHICIIAFLTVNGYLYQCTTTTSLA